MDGFADVPVNAPALPHSRHNGGEIVIRQHHVRRRLRHLCAVFAHGAADVRSLEGGRVVHPIPCHGHHIAPALEGLHNFHLVLGRHPGKHLHIHNLGAQLSLCKPVKLRACHGPVPFPCYAHPAGNGKGCGGVVACYHHREDACPLALGDSGLHPLPGRILHADKPAEDKAAFCFPVVPGQRVHVLIGHPQHPQGLFRQLPVVRQNTGLLPRPQGHHAVAPQHPGTPGNQHVRRALGDNPHTASCPVGRGHHLPGRGKGDFPYARAFRLQLPLLPAAGPQEGRLCGVARKLSPLLLAVVAQGAKLQGKLGVCPV